MLALANSILENYNGNTGEDRRTEAALEMKQRELNRLQKRMDNLIEMRADGDLSKDMFRNLSSKLTLVKSWSRKTDLTGIFASMAIRTSFCTANWKENADLLRKL